MLVLTRKEEESIIINDTIEIKIIGIKQDQVKIGIVAPNNVKIYRKELYEEVKAANINSSNISMEDMKKFLKDKGGL